MTDIRANTRMTPVWWALRLVALTLGLFWTTGWIVWPMVMQSRITDWYVIGFPFIIREWGLCHPDSQCVTVHQPALAGNLLVWVLVSATLLRARPSPLAFWLVVVGLALLVPVLGMIVVQLFNLLP